MYLAGELNNTTQKSNSSPLVLCLGAPGSGLDLLSQCLQFLGFKSIDGGASGAIIIHAVLCRDLGVPYLSAGSLSNGWQHTTAAKRAKQRIRNLLDRHIGSDDSLVLADSFLGRVYPLWQNVFAEFNIRPRHLHLLRHPLEVARSLAASENMELTRAHILWLSYVRDILNYGCSHDTVRIFFDQLLADPINTLYDALIMNDPPLIKDGILPARKSVLWNHIQPDRKHQHAGSASGIEMEQFAAFTRVYDDQRLQQAAMQSGNGAVSDIKQNPYGPSGDGLLNAMFQVIGCYETGEYNQTIQRKQFPDNICTNEKACI